MGARTRAHDWTAHPLGSPDTWPEAQRAVVSMILNSPLMGAVLWGPELRMLYNDAYCSTLGERHPSALGRPLVEVWAGIVWDQIGSNFLSVMATGQALSDPRYELPMLRQGRVELTYWNYSVVPIRDGTGTIVGLLNHAIEITGEVRAEEAAKRSNARLETAIKVARLGTYEWHTATGMVDVDARAREIYALPPRGLVKAADIFARMAPDDVDRVQAEATAAVGLGQDFDPVNLGRTIDIDYDIVLPSGSRRSVESSGAILQDPDGTRRMLGTFNDVTDLKRARTRLLMENATLEKEVLTRTAERNRLWDTTNDLMGTAGLDGAMHMVNPAWSRLLGWTIDELLTMPFAAYIHPDDLAATEVVMRRIAAGESVTSFVDRLLTKDGEVRTITWSATLDPDRASKLFHIVGRDITEQLLVEEALRQSQKMEAVGQLTGGLAHDFNNLLAGISGSLELMQLRMQQGRLNDVDRYMGAAQGATKRAAALTHRLLAFSRRQTLDPKPTDVNRLVSGMQEMIQRTVGPGIPVEVVGASGLWPALVDPSQLENALLNLCINARDAMPEGGRITVETLNKWIDERASSKLDMPEGQYLSLCVTDTGTGMSPEIIARVFEPFFTTKPIGEGTGLGLSMIYGFAQQSGGQVRIYSEVGQGSTICIYLPRHYGEVSEETIAVKADARPSSEQSATVLIVDDEVTVRMLVTDILEDLGYLAIEAGDSAAGLKILQSDVPINLLVTDVGLPGGMNGRQMADAARVKRPDLKVLFITGYAENAALGNGHLTPGMAVLTKPFAMEAMTDRIRSMIEADKEAKRLRQ